MEPTSTSALPGAFRSAMAASYGEPFEDVRIHTGSRASALTGSHRAHAVTWGRQIAVADRSIHPSSLHGALVLAHELAHMHARNGSSSPDAETAADRDAVRAVARMGHPELAGLPTSGIASLLSEPSPPRGGRGSLQLQACSREPARDWEGTGNARAEDAARMLRAALTERTELMGRETLSEADHQRLDELDATLASQIGKLRRLGISLPVEQLYERVVEDAPITDLMRVGIQRIAGGDPPSLLWGERRQFRAVVGYLPPSVDVRYRWRLKEGHFPEIPLPEASNQSPTAELGDEYWRRRVEDELRGDWTPPETFQVGARLEVGTHPADEAWSPPLRIRHELPERLDISISPQAPQPVGAAPDAAPRVLVGARLRASPSWLPRMAPASGEPSHAIWWSMHRGRRLIFSGWGMFGSGPCDTPGRYTIRAEVHPFPRRDLPRPRTTPLRTAVLSVDAVSSSDLAEESFDRVAAQMEGLTYDRYRSELAGRVQEANLVMRARSTEQGEVDERHEALVEMDTEVRRHMETTSTDHRRRPGGIPLLRETQRTSAPLPFPDSEDQFDETAYYARALPAVFVHHSVGVPQPLTLFTQLHHDGRRWRAKVVDATTRDVVRHEGEGDHPYAATQMAIQDWMDDNEYPSGGHVRYAFQPFPRWAFEGTFSTSSWEKTLVEWFDRVLFVVGTIAGILLMLAPEPTGLTKAAGYALLAASVLRATYGIYQSMDLGRPALHERHILEGVGIIAGVVGLRGGAQVAAATRTAAQGEALVGRAAMQFRVGRGMIYMSTGMDVGTFVYAAGDAIGEVRRRLSGSGEGDDQAALLRIVGQLAMQGVLIIGSNRDLFRGAPARGTGRSVVHSLAGSDGEVRLPADARARVEAELRSLGATEDLSGLSDLDLLSRYQERLSRLHGDAVAAVRATNAGDYLAAIRRPGVEPGDVGGTWDWSRFDSYPPGQRWQPGDPIDAPHQQRTGEWVYPDYNQQGRGRYWRNRAHFELEARRAVRRPDSTSRDPIRAMSEGDLRALRDNSSPNSPRIDGQPIELEHQGVPQRVTRALEALGFSESEARRISRASDPRNLFPVEGIEHAFFDAYAQYADAHADTPRRLNRRRTDASGQTWEHTLTSDERVQRPLSPMSDGELRALIETIQSGGHAANFGRSASTLNLRNWIRRECHHRGMPLPF